MTETPPAPMKRAEPPIGNEPYAMSDIRAHASLVGDVVARVDPQVRERITSDLALRTTRLYLTGCGDSYYAGIAARLAFDLHAGVPVEPAEALELSRYGLEFAPAGAAVLGISNSGAVSRTIEAMRRARRRGLTTIAVTGSAGSDLAAAGDVVLLQTVPRLAHADQGPTGPYGAGSLGLGNFAASLVTLYLVAIRLGEHTGRLSPARAEELRALLVGLEPVLDRTAEQCEAPAMALAERFWQVDAIQLLGGGPSHATALFGAAKLFEQPNLNGVPVQLEEWAHEQYFLVRPGTTPMVVVCPRGRSRDRALEQVRGARDVGGWVAAICAEDDDEVREAVDLVLPIGGDVPEEFSPLATIIPTMLVATAVHRVRGRPPRVGEFGPERMRDVNFRQIFRSVISEE